MEDNSDMEDLTLAEVVQEFHLNRNTVNVWVWSKKIPSRKMYTELGVPYYVVRRGDVSRFLKERPKRGRPIKRSI